MTVDRRRLGVPTDKDILAAVGTLSIAHGNLEMIQIMWIKTLGSTPLSDIGKLRSKHDSAKKARCEILRLAKFGSGGAVLANLHLTYDQLKTLVTRAWCLSEKRNDLMHGWWGRDEADQWKFSPDGDQWKDLPSHSDISNLAAEIEKLVTELNDLRLGLASSGALHIVEAQVSVP